MVGQMPHYLKRESHFQIFDNASPPFNVPAGASKASVGPTI